MMQNAAEESSTHLALLESQHLETIHRGGSRERDVCLTFFEHFAEVDFDAIEGCGSARCFL